MFLERLKFFHFRNLSDQTLELSASLNLITGANGQGKTNIVEAVHLLSTGKSFRTSSTDEMIRWREEAASVFGTQVSGAQGAEGERMEIGLIISHDGKEAYVQGERAKSLNEFLGKLSSVSFTPTDIALVKGAPQLRRKFLDRYLADSHPAILPAMLAFQRGLRNKNQLLRSGQADIKQLEAWEYVMSRAAIELEGSRRSFLARLEEVSAAEMNAIAERDGPLSLKLQSNVPEAACESIENMMGLYRRHRERELRVGGCVIGPHQDDILILLDGHEARAFASQGQARTISLALRLGVIRLLEKDRHDSPVVLLDDFDSELDKERREAVMSLVLQPKRQVFITGTSLPSLPLERFPGHRVMIVRSGRIETAA